MGACEAQEASGPSHAMTPANGGPFHTITPVNDGPSHAITPANEGGEFSSSSPLGHTHPVLSQGLLTSCQKARHATWVWRTRPLSTEPGWLMPMADSCKLKLSQISRSSPSYFHLPRDLSPPQPYDCQDQSYFSFFGLKNILSFELLSRVLWAKIQVL